MGRGIHYGCSFFLSRECFWNRDILVSQCLEEELAAELVGNMVGLNAGGNPFREEVVGEAGPWVGKGLPRLPAVLRALSAHDGRLAARKAQSLGG